MMTDGRHQEVQTDPVDVEDHSGETNHTPQTEVSRLKKVGVSTVAIFSASLYYYSVSNLI